MEVRFTLVGEGPFDSALMPIIRWALLQHTHIASIAGEFADPSRLPRPARGLAARLATALKLYPCNLLFVHRDADNQGRLQRLSEINAALHANSEQVPHVPVIPIRMTEAWLLISEEAIRRAAANPNGRASLCLPSISKLEGRPNPKRELHQILKTASGLTGRLLTRFDEKLAAKRVAELIEDYAPLRQLTAFRDFEADLSSALRTP